MAIKSAASVASAFAARYPNAGQAGVLDSVSASAESGVVDSVQAMAIKGFASVSGSLQWVRVTTPFYVGGDPVSKDDFVQVPEGDAMRLVRAQKAELATDEEVARAQKAAK